ncbi:hypothetical protein WUBG_14244 [Wuchereria bancrofti]|uniref:Uncharacterized protein n=1 Tax=Wuchereria bancrofti TaxID=6293 RepID=J9DYM2_WUCBA|nr:hypothetical protein WUBG_14244 [Wuchereria bancrofti]
MWTRLSVLQQCLLSSAVQQCDTSTFISRPIGGSCEFTQQCVNSMEGLSICELGICRCLPGAQVNGFSCIKRFSISLNDAGQSSMNGTSVDESDAVVTGS